MAAMTYIPQFLPNSWSRWLQVAGYRLQVLANWKIEAAGASVKAVAFRNGAGMAALRLVASDYGLAPVALEIGDA